MKPSDSINWPESKFGCWQSSQRGIHHQPFLTSSQHLTIPFLFHSLSIIFNTTPSYLVFFHTTLTSFIYPFYFYFFPKKVHDVCPNLVFIPFIIMSNTPTHFPFLPYPTHIPNLPGQANSTSSCFLSILITTHIPYLFYPFLLLLWFDSIRKLSQLSFSSIIHHSPLLSSLYPHHITHLLILSNYSFLA